MKVLIADDDKVLVHALTKGLDDNGFDVLTAQDAVHGWLNTIRYVPDAVVLDLQMPGGSGVNLLQKMKQSSKTKAIPTIVITATQNRDLLQQAEQAGADVILPKPVGIQELLKTLGELGLSPKDSEKARQRSHEPIRVLVADDDPANLRIIEVLLTKSGYSVTLARDGNEAWQTLLSPNPPQFAILDWAMPGLQGIEICKRLRGAIRDEYTYVILLTAKGQKAEIAAGMDAGADDYIVKPFEADDLRARLAAGRRILSLQEDLLAARAALRAE